MEQCIVECKKHKSDSIFLSNIFFSSTFNRGRSLCRGGYKVGESYAFYKVFKKITLIRPLNFSVFNLFWWFYCYNFYHAEFDR